MAVDPSHALQMEQPEHLLQMERIVLDVLEFRLSSPSSYTFLHLLAQMCSSSVTPSVLSIAMYICELATLEYDMHHYRHSCRAAAALLVGHLTVGDAGHLPILASAIRSMCIPVQQLGACMASLLQLQQAAYHHNLAAAAAAVARFAAPAASFSSQAGTDPIGDLLSPLRVKFGAPCWCEVSACIPVAALPPPHVLGCC